MDLILSDVCVRYGTTQVLWDVSLDVPQGETVVIMGPNGSGKSTVLKAIYGLSPAFKGTIRYGDRDLRSKAPHDMPGEGLGLVLERRRLFTDMSVLENVTIGAFHPAAKPAFEENLAFVKSLFPIIEERAGERAGLLSGGQQQMIAIARGLMANPRLLLIDEPFLGLSPTMVKEIASLIRVIKDRGISVLFNEQNVQLSLDLADRVYLLESGRLVLGGPSDEVARSSLIQEVYLGHAADKEPA